MRYTIKEKPFTKNDRYLIYDQSDGQVFTVDSKIFSAATYFFLRDAQGQEKASIRQLVWSFIPAYGIYRQDKPCVEIRRRFGFSLRDRFVMTAVGQPETEVWITSLMGRVQFFKTKKLIAEAIRKTMTASEVFEVTINDDEDDLLMLAAMLALISAYH